MSYFENPTEAKAGRRRRMKTGCTLTRRDGACTVHGPAARGRQRPPLLRLERWKEASERPACVENSALSQEAAAGSAGELNLSMPSSQPGTVTPADVWVRVCDVGYAGRQGLADGLSRSRARWGG